MMHIIMQHTPSQLVFGREAIRNINQEANWQLIKQFKQALLNKGNQKENCRWQSRVFFNQDAYIGPYTVIEDKNNGTVRAHRGNVTDTYYMHNIIPFKE